MSTPGHPSVTDLTVGSYLADWLARQATQLAPSTCHGYESMMRCYLVPGLGDVPLTALSTGHLNPFYVRLLRTGSATGGPLSLSTVASCHRLLHKACEDARRLGLLAVNPCADALVPRRHPDLPNGGRRAMSVWTPEQLRTFLRHTAGHRLHSLWVLAAGTGMRRGELLALSWDDVDLDARQLVVRHALSVSRRQMERRPPKSGRARTLTFDRRVAAALVRQQARQRALRAKAAAWDDPWGLVFTSATGRWLHPEGVSSDFARLMARAPVPTIRLHDLRHTHATHMLAAGVSVKVVAERLGHISAQTTLDVYAHVLPAMDADAVARYAAHVHARPGELSAPA